MSNDKSPWSKRSEAANVALFVAAVAGLMYLVARITNRQDDILPACLVSLVALIVFVVLVSRPKKP